MQLDPSAVRQQVENLKLMYPELLEDEEAWLLSLESETDVNELLTSIVRRIEDAKAMKSGTAERLDDLRARKDRFSRREDSLRELAFKVMQMADMSKAELPEATLSIRKGAAKLVGEADPATLPDELCKISREPNKTAIKEAVARGDVVPGYALSNGEPSLSIRVK
ncbi:siphovirus Gp157 family protein [Afipia carboxidovorans]|uniref:siphovirus Gp157 family protein n=1 Tax=Afipia carboxidovorans TaxID=40137 RepID=UPI00308B4772|nr:hypothetical protein CRBSH125_09790 [Afipia carboxidovorans]BEV47323.1 hypothetical protein CRBSH125_35060 [Afipia carboxidovorans]